jgi:hypothetical protein
MKLILIHDEIKIKIGKERIVHEIDKRNINGFYYK